ncbi:CHAD domain-containing protein [Isoptericola sp. BMS4]|uniref:CHAD domain-containing protein n=1 Tax=Isoptericola sp. BMS4 TaxID=2527875 RepID=UPI001423E403|nr:CHAD domain-containing protein [Isoptericola sp. BMS4]
MTRSAGDVLSATIRAQVDVVVGARDAVRRDTPDAVHRQRVAVRRLRTLLRVHRDCLAADGPLAPRALAADLAAYARVLGDVRDAEVQQARLAELADELAPASAAVRSGLVTLDDALRRRHAAARARLVAALDAPAHADLVRRLRALAAGPPLTDRAASPARDVLQPALGRAVRRARRRAAPVAAATEAARPAPHEVHRLRKAARRARYTGDVLASFGSGRRSRRSARTASRMKRLQSALGTVHDADTLSGTLTALRDGGTAAAVDACAERETRRAEAALARSRGLLP